MASTFAQRLTTVANIMKKGQGVIAFPDGSADLIYVKDPDWSYAGTPATNSPPWVSYTNSNANSAYG